MVTTEPEIVGVTLGYDAKPTLLYEDGTVLHRTAEMIFNEEYYPNGKGSWPIDPDTGKRMPINVTRNFKRRASTMMILRRLRARLKRIFPGVVTS